jgi:glycerol kinase
VSAARRFVLALDQGTTGSTALVVDGDGAVRARGYAELPQHYPRPGWVEHDPEDIWTSMEAAAGQALRAAEIMATEVAAIGITNQRETVVVWDRAGGRPIHRAIVWQCRRTAPMCDRLKADGFEALFRRKTGLVLDAYFSGTKIRWLLDHVPGAREEAERGELAFGTVDTWLLWRLTGGRVHASEPSNASRTLCFDIEKLAWDEELTTALGVPMALLPEVRPSAGVFGETVRGALFPAGIPITGIAGDQQAALFGQHCVEPGAAKNTYGTGCFLLVNTGARPVPSTHGLLTTVAWSLGGRVAYALEGSVFIAGAAVQWLRDGLGLLQVATESEVLARGVPDTGGVHFVPAFVGLGTPHWEAEARGTITGITRGTTRAHLVRAALEAMAFSSADLLGAMAGSGDLRVPALRVDGGASANDWLMQFQADVLGIPVERPDMVETTALGAAGLAGIALGVWNGTGEFLAGRRFQRFVPGTGAAERTALRAGWERAVGAALAWARSGDGSAAGSGAGR